MLKIIARIVMALQGALALFIAANVFMDPVKIGDQLGIAPIGTLGLSTFRGDIGSLFAGAGLFMLAAAVRGNRLYLVPPLVFTSIALAARTASMALTGFAPELVQPMVVEGVTITLALAAYVILGRD
ncbi:MAG: hypothetical protein K8S25_03040 [Alphaproteobacteria bacterium]|nr:hypothetical protein [Alphaproteobacteria bacterium]